MTDRELYCTLVPLFSNIHTIYTFTCNISTVPCAALLRWRESAHFEGRPHFQFEADASAIFCRILVT